MNTIKRRVYRAYPEVLFYPSKGSKPFEGWFLGSKLKLNLEIRFCNTCLLDVVKPLHNKMRKFTSMKCITWTIAFLFIIASVWGQQTINASIQHDGLTRDYILYVPASYTGLADVPLVFNFHGYTSNAFQQMFYGDFRPIADTVGFIIVHPEGTRDNLGNTHFNVGWGSSSVDDIGYTSALIDTINAAYAINQNRIYSTGMSNGGFMSYHLACNLSDKIAAIASVTGSMSPAQFTNCIANRPVPILEIHGTADPTVPYTGGFISTDIEDVLDYWVTHNQCDPTPTIFSYPDIDPNDGSTAEFIGYADGEAGTVVEHIKIENGAHTWPSNLLGGPGTNNDVNGSIEVWKFFDRFDLQGEIMSSTSEPVSNISTFKTYPNPIQNRVMVDLGTNEVRNYSLLNSFGLTIAQGELNNNIELIDVSFLSPGMYFMQIGNEVKPIVKL